MALLPLWPGRFLLFLVTVHLTAQHAQLLSICLWQKVQPWPNFHEGFSGARRSWSSHRCWPWASLQNNPCNWKNLEFWLEYGPHPLQEIHGSLNSSDSFETGVLPTAWSFIILTRCPSNPAEKGHESQSSLQFELAGWVPSKENSLTTHAVIRPPRTTYRPSMLSNSQQEPQQ